MKKSYMILAIVILINAIALGITVFMCTRTIKVEENANFKKIYSSESDIENIEIRIYDLFGTEIGKIDTKEEIKQFINSVKSEDVKPILNSDKIKMGDTYRLVIANKEKNKTIRFNIGNSSVAIGRNNYENTVIFNRVRDLLDKCMYQKQIVDE